MITSGAQPPSTSRVHLIIMFTDVTQSTRIAAQMEPEHYGSLLDKIRTGFSDIIEHHGGEVVRIDGDGFIFIFGYPDWFENSARHAADAAIDMREFIRNSSHPPQLVTDIRLSVHTAIHSGVVLMKTGDMVRGRYEILGDATNVTAKLCQHANGEDILISDGTLGRSNIHFECGPPITLNVAGAKSPLRIRHIFRRRESTTLPSTKISPRTGFVGRQDSLDWLDGFCRNEQSGVKIAMVTAEAGLGKTRLIQEFAERNRNTSRQFHFSLCEQYLGARIFQPIKQLARSLAGASLDASKNHSFNALMKLDTQIDAMTRHLTELCQSCGDSPIILVIDDWQWVDDASRQVVQNMAKICVQPIRFILISRTVDPVFAAMTEVSHASLPTLSQGEISEVIDALHESMEPFSRMRIEKYSGGNPLYIEEMCHAFRDSRFSRNTGEAGAWLKSLIYTRYSQLSNDLRSTLNLCAVVGHIIPDDLIEALDISSADLFALREKDFLFPAETLKHHRFKHVLTRDAIYNMIGLNERTELHARVRLELEALSDAAGREPPHDQLAYHSAKAGDPQSSLRHSGIAGHAALSLSLLDKAQMHYANALKQAERLQIDPKAHSELVTRYGQSCLIDPAVAQNEILQRVAKIALTKDDRDFTHSCEFWLGSNFYGLGKLLKSRIHFERALAVISDKPDNSSEDPRLARTNAGVGQTLAALGNYTEAFAKLDHAIAIKTQTEGLRIPSASLAYMFSSKAFALGELGRFGEAHEHFTCADQSMRDFTHQTYTSILGHKTGVALWNADFDHCHALSGRNMELSKKVRTRHNFAMASFMNAAAEFYRLKDPARIDDMAKATEWLMQDNIFQNMSINFAYLSDAYAQTQQWAPARKFAAKALWRAREGDCSCEALAYRSLARLALAGQTKHSAQYYLAGAYRSAESRQSVREIHNTQYFENRYMGGSHDVPTERPARQELA